jgi:pimeloyl-ACP methyl ester carboxylesterase
LLSLLSDNLRAETPSCRDYADSLDDLSALGIDGFDIVANSFGTRVAQCFAYYRPGRIGRAVFTGTSIPHSTLPEERMQSVEAPVANELAILRIPLLRPPVSVGTCRVPLNYLGKAKIAVLRK